MSELILTRDERLALRARAHHLNPVVLLGTAGLTEAVLKETDRALAAHELIKVRIPGDDRAQREAVCAELAGRLGAARIQAIGKLLVLYRPKPEETAPPKRPPARPRPPAAPAAGRPGRPAPPARDLRRRIGGRGR
jgi:putative YhbY family RNA-binding protein